MEFPSMLKVSGAGQKWDGTSKVCLHYTSHKNVHMEANVQTNPGIQNAGWADIC